MAPLPAIKLRFTFSPFHQCAAEPFKTIQGGGIKRQKGYLYLFTCLQTRAIHLETASAVDAESFVNAIARFTSRRGVPKEIIGDNGNDFVGAVNELLELVSHLDEDTTQDKETCLTELNGFLIHMLVFILVGPSISAH